MYLLSLFATNLYAGLSSDTGCFQHSTTNAISHKHAYEMLEKDIDLEEIAEEQAEQE